MPRDPREKCSRSWEDIYGTTASGNLPQHRTKECVQETINISNVQTKFPWVTWADFHYYHIRCPYSIEAGVHFVMDRNPNSPTYWQNRDVISEAVVHPTTSGIMIRHNRGSKYGWLCVDPDCPYYKGTVSGSRINEPYFYI